MAAVRQLNSEILQSLKSPFHGRAALVLGWRMVGGLESIGSADKYKGPQCKIICNLETIYMLNNRRVNSVAG